MPIGQPEFLEDRASPCILLLFLSSLALQLPWWSFPRRTRINHTYPHLWLYLWDAAESTLTSTWQKGWQIGRSQPRWWIRHGMALHDMTWFPSSVRIGAWWVRLCIQVEVNRKCVHYTRCQDFEEPDKNKALGVVRCSICTVHRKADWYVMTWHGSGSTWHFKKLSQHEAIEESKNHEFRHKG